jgi:hypothetical protein
MVRSDVRRAARLVLLAGASLAFAGCSDLSDALNGTKMPPDEFTVLTKSPLVIPPDYNLRPPQPGIASRNEPDPDDQARAALFQQDPAMQAASLGTDYSDGEKTLLAKTNALSVDPDIRKQLLMDFGQDDQGPAFTQKVLYQNNAPGQPAAAVTAAPAPAAKPAPAAQPAGNPPLIEGTGAPYPPPRPAPAPAAPAPQ